MEKNVGEDETPDNHTLECKVFAYFILFKAPLFTIEGKIRIFFFFLAL